MGISHKTGIAIVLSVLSGAGCGVIYTPQEFEKSNFSYGYKGDFETAIEVLPMTFMSARLANSDDYVPRTLPEFFEQEAPTAIVSTRDRLAALGLEPALVLQPSPPPVPYGEGSEILPPVQRNEGLQPLSLPQPPLFPDLPSYIGQGRSDSQPANARNAQNRPPSSEIDLSSRLERPRVRRQAINVPLPDIDPGTYRIGPGDVIGLQLSPSQDALSRDPRLNQRLLVQENGQIFLPEVGTVTVGNLTLANARQLISERLVSGRFGFNPGVQILEFSSKSIAASGLDGAAKIIPITVRPTTLSEAVVSVGGFGSNPEDTIVRVLRQGTIYEMSGDQILSSSQLSNRILIEDDILSVTSGYNPDSAISYFDQQMRLREVERSRYEDELRARAEARADAQERRAFNEATRQRMLFDLELRNYRIEADTLRRQAEIARLQAQREADQLNEQARIANLEARQVFLDKVRALKELNRESMRRARNETRETLIANQAERVREQADRRALLELELQEERLRLEQLSARLLNARNLFNERVRLGAVPQDYVTIAGETRVQTAIALPFNSQLTLNRVLYGEGNGIDLLSGDSSEIYVIRVPKQDRIESKVIAYHLNASNPAALSVASIFEMRPNDVVYVNPQPITKWNRVLTQLLPSTGLLQSGISAVTGN